MELGKAGPRVINGITPLFEPESVAVVGSLRKGGFGGYVVMQNLLDFGFQGEIYPVNPQHDTVLSMKAYPRVRDIPRRVDLAVIMTAAKAVPEIIEDCVHNGVKVAIVVADGFAERDIEGRRLQHEVGRIAGMAGLRLLGPNTIGVVNPALGLVTCPYRVLYDKIYSGHIAICGQTGIIGPQLLPLEEMHYGVSKICDFGNKCDIDEVDLVEYLDEDPQTKVIAIHFEGLQDGRAFLDKVKAVVPRKPVIVLKPGRTEDSRTAMASHTGTLAGEEAVYESAFKQAGVLRVDTLKELVDLPKVFAHQPLPKGNRLAIVTVSGGAGVMGIDVAAQNGLTLATLSAGSLKRLAEISPLLVGNPVDMGPALAVNRSAMVPYFREMLLALCDDENIDLLGIACPYGLRGSLDEIFGQLAGWVSKTMAFWVPSPSLSGAEEVARKLEGMGLPTYPDCETAVKALSAAYKYSVIRSKLSR